MSGTAASFPQPPTTVPALFSGVLDDAAIFPPGNARMDDALHAHEQQLRGRAAALLGSFTCSSSRLDELLVALPSGLPTLGLSLVVPQGMASLESALAAAAAAPRLRLRSVELPAAPVGPTQTATALASRLPPGAHGYVELPLDGGLAAAAEAVATAGCRVKLRTGGTRACAFPSAAALAAGLDLCRVIAVPVKLTAGLHHAVRHRDPHTGFEHHGFLNVMAAVAAAVDGAPSERLAGLLEQRDGAALARILALLAPAHVARVRDAFTGFGTCSTPDALADLLALGLLGTPA